MVRKSILFISILTLALFLSSCSGGSGEVDTSSPGVFFGGSEGIDVAFEPLSVLEDGIYTIYDTEDFPLEVILTNSGEHLIEAGDVRLQLLGPAQADFTGISNWEMSNSEEIEEISEFNPDGDEELISFTGGDYATYDAEVVGYQDLVWYVDYDYDYKTYLIINDVCFKGDSGDERVCEIQEGRTYSVSGAPITITSVEQDSAGQGKMMLKIGISNVGDGESTIVGEEFDDRFSQVSYTIDDSLGWECKSGGREDQARLVDGAAEVICQLSEALDEEDLYTKSVSISFEYTYRDIVSETLRVKESVE